MPSHLQLACRQSWPALWELIQRARFESRADAGSTFRGSGQYAVRSAGRLSWHERKASADFPRPPRMARWVSDVVNRLVSVLFDVMQRHFRNQGIECSRTRNAKKFRNNCDIIPRFHQRFCQMCGEPDISSEESSYQNAHHVTEWPSLDAIFEVVQDEVSMMCGKTPSGGAITNKARIAHLRLDSHAVFRTAREVWVIWAVVSQKVDHETGAWLAVRDLDRSLAGESVTDE